MKLLDGCKFLYIVAVTIICIYLAILLFLKIFVSI